MCEDVDGVVRGVWIEPWLNLSLNDENLKIPTSRKLELNAYLDYYFEGENSIPTITSDERTFEFYESGLKGLVDLVDNLEISEGYRNLKIIKNPKINLGIKVKNP